MTNHNLNSGQTPHRVLPRASAPYQTSAVLLWFPHLCQRGYYSCFILHIERQRHQVKITKHEEKNTVFHPFLLHPEHHARKAEGSPLVRLAIPDTLRDHSLAKKKGRRLQWKLYVLGYILLQSKRYNQL